MARRLRQAHAARDHGLIDLAAEVTAQLSGNLRGQIHTSVVHREHQPLDLQTSVEALGAHLNARQQIRQSLERVIFALHRHQHAIRRHQRIYGQQL